MPSTPRVCEHDPVCASRWCAKKCDTVVYQCGTYNREWICRPCHFARGNRDHTAKNKYAREWRRANPEKAREYGRRATLKRYGLTPEQHAEIWRRQGERCAICRRDDAWRWSIDHDHACCAGDTSCGACVRGILCQNCNVGIAHFRDDSSLLDAAKAYLGGVSFRR